MISPDVEKRYLLTGTADEFENKSKLFSYFYRLLDF